MDATQFAEFMESVNGVRAMFAQLVAVAVWICSCLVFWAIAWVIDAQRLQAEFMECQERVLESFDKWIRGLVDKWTQRNSPK